MPSYPPEPWNLAGEAYLSVWTVPLRDLPRVPRTVTPVALGGAAVVVTAWIDYRPPGELAYHELLSTVAVRHGRRPTGTITEIWVDSEVSLAGGRELWGIPKEPATLGFTHDGRVVTATADSNADWIATAAFVPRGRPVIPIRTRFGILQAVDGAPWASPVRARGRARLASADWNVNPDGPLGYLAGRRPLASAHLTGVRLRFGRTR